MQESVKQSYDEESTKNRYSKTSVQKRVLPTVCEETTRVIVRKFDMPTRSVAHSANMPTRCVAQPSILRSPLTFCRQKEKWKYQHDVENGHVIKITKPLIKHVPQNNISDLINKKMSCATPSDEVKSVNQTVPLVSQTVVNNAKVTVSAETGMYVLSTKDDTPKVITTGAAASGTTKQITLSNFPRSVMGKSVQIVDSKIVNGKIHYYMKAFKDVGKDTSVVKSSTNTELPVPQLKALSGLPHHNTEQLKNDVNVNKPVTVISSGVNSHPVMLPSNTKMDSSKQIILKLDSCTLKSRNSTVLNSGLPQQDNTHNVLPEGIVQNVSLNDRPLRTYSKTTQKSGDLLKSHVNMLQNGAELVEVDSAFSFVDRKEDGKNAVNQLQVCRNSSEDATDVTNAHNLTECFVVKGEENSKTSGEVVTQNSRNHNNGYPDPVIVNHKQNDKIPSDDSVIFSQMPCNKNACLGTVSVGLTNQEKSMFIGQELSILIPPENVVVNRNNTVQQSVPTAMNQRLSKCQSDVLVVVNQQTNNSNSQDTNSTGIHLNRKYDELMEKRKQIALQFQHDMQRAQDIPKKLRTVELPARKVQVVDTFTQTDLFSLIEPTRMVEMVLEKPANGDNTMKPKSNSQLRRKSGHVNVSGQTFCKNALEQQISTDAPISKRIRLDEKAVNSEIAMENSTTIRCEPMDVDTSSEISMNSQTFTASYMDIFNKENRTEFVSNNKNNSASNLSRNINEQSLENIRSLMQSTTRTSSYNGQEKINVNGQFDSRCRLHPSFDVKERLYKDFRSSLLPDKTGNMPIHNAVMDKDLRQVMRQCIVLAAMKHTIDVKNNEKETPLHLAIMYQEVKMIELLLKQKADVEITDGQGSNALHIAVEHGTTAILKMLLSEVEIRSPLLNMCNDEGYSPLHLCALWDHREQAQLLLAKGADINIRDRKSGRTPLFHALEGEHTEMSRMLVTCGASTTIANFSGQTPLNASEVTLVLEDVLQRNQEVNRVCTCPTKANVYGKQCDLCHGSGIDWQQNVNSDNDTSLGLLNNAFNDR